MRKKVLPWERKFYREKESFDVRKQVLLWERKFYREKESFDVRKQVLPWERKFCREKESFAVRKKVLPWERKFCREKESFDVRKKVFAVRKKALTWERKFLPGHLWATIKIDMIRLRFKAKTTYFIKWRNHASTVWDPHHANHIKKIEAIQRRSARFVRRDYDQHSSVSDMLKELNWPILQERRYIARKCLFHKAVNDNIAVKIPSYIMTPKQLQGRSQRQFVNIDANTNTYLYSFFPKNYQMLEHITNWIQAT